MTRFKINKCRYCNLRIRKVKNFGIMAYPDRNFHMSCHIKYLKEQSQEGKERE